MGARARQETIAGQQVTIGVFEVADFFYPCRTAATGGDQPCDLDEPLHPRTGDLRNGTTGFGGIGPDGRGVGTGPPSALTAAQAGADASSAASA